jgi:putative membrane protein
MILSPEAAVTPQTIGQAWTFEPAVVIALAVSGAAYAVGTAALWRRAGHGHGVRPLQLACFAAGWTVLALALISPLHQLGESLFYAHMIQHELLMVVAAPLLVLGRPLVPMLWATSIAWRRRLGRVAQSAAVARVWQWVQRPLVAWLIQAVVIWGWHAPRLYDASVRHEWVHAVQHSSFMAAALLFWWSVIEGSPHRAARGKAVVSVVTTAGHTGALGALLTFAPVPLYAVYQATTPWGVTPLEDQQLAGLIMWIPSGISYLVAALLLTAAWVHGAGTRGATRPRAGDSVATLGRVEAGR